MKELPLFPLGTVLFPGMVLPLHIFEPRYKTMINECVQSGDPFGVLLIEKGHEVGEPAKPFTIGTTARITHVQPFSDGRMNIQAVGYQRFRVKEFIEGKPYLSGMVEDYPIPKAQTEDTAALVAHLTPDLKAYLDLLMKATDTDLTVDELPDDGLALSLFAAITMPIPMSDKQQILEKNSIDAMLRSLQALLRREMMLLEHMVNTSSANDNDISFSAN